MGKDAVAMTSLHKFITRSLAVGLLAVASHHAIAAEPAPKPTLVSVTKIWDTVSYTHLTLPTILLV